MAELCIKKTAQQGSTALRVPQWHSASSVASPWKPIGHCFSLPTAFLLSSVSCSFLCLYPFVACNMPAEVLLGSLSSLECTRIESVCFMPFELS